MDPFPSSEDLAISSTVTLLNPFLKNNARADFRICFFLLSFSFILLSRRPTAIPFPVKLLNYGQYLTNGHFLSRTIKL